MVGFVMRDLDDVLALTSRDKVFKNIEDNPGLHFRELQRRTGLATGALQYHIDYLIRKHYVRQEKQGKFVRFFSVRGPKIENEKVLFLLRQNSLRAIILFLLGRRRANNDTIAEAVSLSPSTTSWHLQKLIDAEIVGSKKAGRKTYYFLCDKEIISELLISYQTSFLDSAVDSFVELFEQEF